MGGLGPPCGKSLIIHSLHDCHFMLSLKSMSGRDIAENTLRLPSIPLGMPSDGFSYLDGTAIADLNLAGANGRLEEG